MQPTKQTAFTLIELLIVVAIIAILAAIAVPNFLEAQTRSKVSRVKTDHRTLATALEAYAVDNNAYPPSGPMLDPRFRRFRPLTSPVAYITQIPRDPFQSIDANAPNDWRHGLYKYGGTPIDEPDKFALASDGPDRQDDTSPLAFYPGWSADLFYGGDPDFDYTFYDPTNGTISRGDVVRLSDYNPGS
jgi:type II secretion system protein G